MVYSIRHMAIVVVVLLLAALGWRAYGHIYESGLRDCRLAQQAVADAAAERARKDAQAELRRARAAAEAQAAARVDQLRRRHALDHDIARRPAPAGCGLDGAAVELLNDAVRAGNAGAGPLAAGGVPGGVPAGAGAD